MSVPNELPAIGSTSQRMRQNPRFDPTAAGIGPEDYFVWTRFDGQTTLRDLILMTGLPTERAVEIVRKLRALGAILAPGEKAEAPPPRAVTPPTGVSTAPRAKAGEPPARSASLAPPAGPGVSRAASPRPQAVSEHPTVERPPLAPDLDDTATTRMPPVRPPTPDPTRMPSAAAPAANAAAPTWTPEETLALAEDAELGPDERQRMLLMHRRSRSDDPATVLGISDGHDAKAVKRAYFALSKEFHPDRYFGKRTGSFAARLNEIFEAISRAYETLSGDRRRASTAPSAAGGRPTPAVEAADLFDRACQSEVSGDHVGALRLFGAAIRIDPSAKYLRRAARCALNAREFATGLEYARKAAELEPSNPSAARLLAHAYKASGDLDAAEQVLLMALTYRTENDQLVSELRADLAEVRRLTR